MSLFSKLFASLFLATALVTSFSPAPTHAANSCLDGSGNLASYCQLDSQNNLNIPEGTLANRVNQVVLALGLIAGVLSVLFIVIGGINYATSEGDPKKLSGAKSTLSFAIAGLIISILAPVIVGFVIAKGPQ